MLRRKLLLVLALLTTMMLVTALSSVLLMRQVLGDMEEINRIAMINTTTTSQIAQSVAIIESGLKDWTHTKSDPGEIRGAMAQLETGIDQLNSVYRSDQGEPDPLSGIERSFADLTREIERAIGDEPINVDATVDSAADAAVGLAIESAREMNTEIIEHANFAFEYIKSQHQAATKRFRYTTIGLAAIFVVLINISIIVLLRASSFVLKPIDRLLEASRRLAAEDYEFRVKCGEHGEFDELARAFNRLAEQLGSNETRKIETLHQLARTLNHELNNAIAIIELQLSMVKRSPGYDAKSGHQLEHIHDALDHMSETVGSLINVRRVVLTDYIKGVKMFDIERSTQPHPSPEQATSTGDPSR